MPARKMHLAQFLMHAPTYHSLAMWRHPRTAAAPFAWDRPELYQHIARVCERGLFDMVFFADLIFISDTYTGSMAPTLRHAAQVPNHDPIPLLSWMGAVTSTIGLAATFSINNQHPFYTARLWATLDHLTSGRTAWNVVTALNHNQSANYGEELPPTDVRYERAEEFMEVCRKLWDSWEADAVVMDRERGVFADPEKVHRIEHAGAFFRSRGPLTVTRSPQNGPAIIQAGVSPKGRDFAARHAEAIFAIQPSVPMATEYYADVKARVAGQGRDPGGCKILFGVQPIVGTTEDDAREKQATHNALVPLEGGLGILSGHLDFDCSTLPLDATMATIAEPKLQRMQRVYRALDGTPLTVRDVAQRHGQSVGLPQIVGTPEQIADQLEDYFIRVGGDGFMLSPIYCPGAIEEFVDLVVPVLQRRGLYRTEYRGRMQRDHLRQDD
jgi:FMN-dependent oxidoreductase (nitrilotriacetate monooxygenase family)